MSSLAAATERAEREASPSPAPPARSHRLTGDALLGLGVAGAAVALAFLTSGNSDPQTPVSGSYGWSEIVATVLGAAACAAAVVLGARGRRWGGATTALFAAFTAFAALSIAWSVQPDWSWYGANQLLCYLSVFAGAAALARVFPERWRAIVGGVAVGMVALSGYSLLAKVFPATLASANSYGRLLAPFGYWNALGAAAALGLPPCLWAAARREGGPVARGLSVPGLTLLISAVVLSYSRSAALVAVIGIAFWVVFVPLRLRTTAMLVLGGLGAIPIVVWALGDPSLTSDGIAHSTQDAAGHSFGIVVVIALVTVTAAGFAAALAMERVAVRAPVRRRIGTALIVAVALIPVAGVAGLAASSRGLTGEISHAWTTLTNSTGTGDTSSRFTQLGSSRPMYWHQGLHVGGDALLKGVGELGYGVARLRYTTPLQPAKSDQAHSYVVQTFADLGLIGVAITLALLIAWAIAAARPLAPRLRWGALSAERVAEREGLVALAALAIAFGIQSSLDWTFYFPGVTIPVLICAGWLAGRGPLLAPVGRLRRLPRLLDRPGAAATITALAAVAVIGGWAMWEPMHSASEWNAAVGAPTTAAALADAHAAASSDPLSDQPLNQLAFLYESNGNLSAARAELTKATTLQPDNPEPWVWLGGFELRHHRPRPAIAAMTRVLALDHTQDLMTGTAGAVITQANAELAAARAARSAHRTRGQ